LSSSTKDAPQAAISNAAGRAAAGDAAEHLWTLMGRVARATAVEQVYDAAMDCLEHALGVERSAVLLFDDAGVMRFVAWRGLSAGYRRTVDGHSPWAPGTPDAAPLVVADVAEDPELAVYGTLFQSEQIAALAFIPLQFGDALLGKFMLYFRRPYAPSSHELAIARAIAGHVAFALDRFRAEEALSAARSALEVRLEREQAARRVAEAESSARTRAEERAKEDESRLRLAMDAGHMGAWEWRTGGDQVTWSEELEALHGLPAGSFRGTFAALLESIHPDDRERVRQAIEHATDSESGEYGVEYRILTPSGEVPWIEARGRRLSDGAGGTRMVGICSDVTARKRREQAQVLLAEAAVSLTASLDYRQTLDTLVRLLVPQLADWCVVHVVGPDGEIHPGELAHADPAKEPAVRALQFRWHFPKDAPMGLAQVIRSGESLLVPRVPRELVLQIAQDPEHLRAMEELLPRSCMVVPLIARQRTLGTITLVAAESLRVFGPEELALAEELASRAALAIDNARLFAEVEEARNKAEESARRLRILAEQSTVMAGALDHGTALRQLASFLVRHVADFCVTYALEPGDVIRRVGLSHRDPAKTALVEPLAKVDPPALDDRWGAGTVMRTGEPLLLREIPDGTLPQIVHNQDQLRILTELRPVSLVMVPIRARGRIIGAISASLAEGAERRYTEDDVALLEELAGRAGLVADNARLFQAAQEAVRTRDEMVAVVSHDIRSPLQTIMTACSILDLDVSEPRKAQSRTVIRRAVGQMERLTTDLLDISRIEAGGIQLHYGEVDGAALVAEVGAVFQPTADAGLIRLEVTAEPELPRLWADRERLLQVLSNLLANAFKFTPQGGRVVLKAASCPLGVRLSVVDTGCGIPPDHLPRLFDRFWQADRKRGPGAGLGLAIVKGLVEGHGGVVEVESTVGAGSTFCVSLPTRAKASPRSHDKSRSILVIDDDEDFRQEVVEVLVGQGYRVVGLPDGRRALDYLEHNEPPGMIFLDLMMPLMDGWELCRAIREVPQLRHVPLVLMSGVAERDVGPALAHATEYVGKPVGVRRLLDVARTHMAAESPLRP
jgi:PAS domain S-box-containing protein